MKERSKAYRKFEGGVKDTTKQEETQEKCSKSHKKLVKQRRGTPVSVSEFSFFFLR